MELNEAVEYIKAMRDGKASNMRIASQANAVIADAYLADHPPDKDEPITPEWLEAQGWMHGGRYNNFDAVFSLYWSTKNVMYLEADPADPKSSIYDMLLPHIKTRGDVIRLVRALKGGK